MKIKIETLVDENLIQRKIALLAKAIELKFKGEELFMVGVLHGSFMFFSDLIRKINGDIKVDFIQASSYGNELKSSGEVRITNPLKHSPENKTVFLIDDIADSGRTLFTLKKLMTDWGAKKVYTIVLVDKPGKRSVPFSVDYSLFTMQDQWVVGYGLDYQGKYRELPFIGAMKFIK